MRLRCSLTLSLALLTFVAAAQRRTIEGVVTDVDGNPIADARVAAVASAVDAYTDALGNYRLRLSDGTERVQATALNYRGVDVFVGTVTRVDFVLQAGLGAGDLATLGGHRPGRTVHEALLPVEVVYAADMAATEPFGTLGQVLTMATTSLTALPQISGTSSDFVDPLGQSSAGPSQIALLINGKRRHRSAQVSTADVFGRGTAGYDLAAIPLAAVARVEVLRGPAAAVYGPDAVAGVVNVVLKREPGLDATAEAGAYVSGNIPDGAAVPDGRFGQGSLGYGLRLGERGGFAHVTAVAARREPTDRMQTLGGAIFSGFNTGEGENPGADVTEAELDRRGLRREDFREGAGQAAEDRVSVVANAELPLGETWALYGFGDFTARRTGATARYALPNEARTNTRLYPNGFAPAIEGTYDDQSAVLGSRGTWGKWELDLSGAYGRSGVQLDVSNTANAALAQESPREFDAGGAAFRQGIARADVRRYFPSALAGLHLSGGTGVRLDGYSLYAGQFESYAGPTEVRDPLDRAVPVGSQGLRGVSNADAGQTERTSVYGYADAELDIVPRVSVAAGVRYESYSDLGGGAMGDLRARVSLSDDIDLRGGLSSGFRAPTLQEQHYRATYQTAGGLLTGVFDASGAAARAIGIEPLALERHLGATAGFHVRLPRLGVELSADAFFVDVDNAATLTSAFGLAEDRRDIDRLLAGEGVAEAAFLANALDTRTAGVTVGVRHASALPYGARLRLHLSGTYARTGVERVNTSAQLFDRATLYLTPANRSLFDAAVPRIRGATTAYLDFRSLTLMLRGNYFGQVEAPTNELEAAQVYSGRPMGDASLTWSPRGPLAITAGASNVLDVYPDRSAGVVADDGRALYSRSAQQFGANGRYVFARLSYGLLP